MMTTFSKKKMMTMKAKNPYNFQTKVHAKWILAGEHAVLRDSAALVFPVPSKYVRLSYTDSEEDLSADFLALYGETLLLFFWGLLKEGFQEFKIEKIQMKGKFLLENNIPMGAGMGFSAALCVAVAKWFAFKGWISNNQLFDCARKFENSFHGKSSGVDIAGVLNNEGVRFKRDGKLTPLSLAWRPKLYLSCSESVSVTAKCIKTVDELWEKDQTRAKRIDDAMIESVNLAEKALASNPQQGLPLLVQSMQIARGCFENWGLVKGGLEEHMQLLMEKGALATKPTGAGNGGYVLSLWEKTPPEDLPFEMDACIESIPV